MGWKVISRRTVLKSGAAAIGLPLLEAMFPLREALAQTMTAPLRTMVVNWPYGSYQNALQPVVNGTSYNFPAQYASLNPFKAQITHVRKLFNYFGNVDENGDHARGQGTYLTQVRLNKSESVIRAGVSMDQIIAGSIGNQTRVKSAYFSGERTFYGDSGYGAVYKNLSWQSSTTPTTLLGDPHQVFDALLAGQGTNPNPNATLTRLRKKKSILDGAVADANRLIASVGTADKQKLDEYLTAVRDVEARISREIAMQGTQPTCSPGTRPPTNQNFQTRTRLYFELMALAAQCDATRVFVYHMGSPYDFGPINGVSGDHHNDYSHHQNVQANIDGMLRIAQWYAEQFAIFLDRMNTTMDINGRSLLYNSMITFGAEMRDSNAHDDYDIPTMIAGNAGGKFTPGRLIVPAANVPMANLWLTIMKTMGVNINTFGELQAASTGTIAL